MGRLRNCFSWAYVSRRLCYVLLVGLEYIPICFKTGIGFNRKISQVLSIFYGRRKYIPLQCSSPAWDITPAPLPFSFPCPFSFQANSPTHVFSNTVSAVSWNLYFMSFSSGNTTKLCLNSKFYPNLSQPNFSNVPHPCLPQSHLSSSWHSGFRFASPWKLFPQQQGWLLSSVDTFQLYLTLPLRKSCDDTLLLKIASSFGAHRSKFSLAVS
jgi:hypothetical protein